VGPALVGGFVFKGCSTDQDEELIFPPPRTAITLLGSGQATNATIPSRPYGRRTRDRGSAVSASGFTGGHGSAALSPPLTSGWSVLIVEKSVGWRVGGFEPLDFRWALWSHPPASPPCWPKGAGADDNGGAPRATYLDQVGAGGGSAALQRIGWLSRTGRSALGRKWLEADDPACGCSGARD